MTLPVIWLPTTATMQIWLPGSITIKPVSPTITINPVSPRVTLKPEPVSEELDG